MFKTLKVRADRRALISAVLLGVGIGLGLGSAYLAGGMARATTDHARAVRLAEQAQGEYSETALQRQPAFLDAGILRIAQAHDPVSGSAVVDRRGTDVRLTSFTGTSMTEGDGAFGGRVPALRKFSVLDSSRDLECLTQAVYFEARGETPAGQAAVAQVVLNRVRTRGFPKSVCGVVFQGAARTQGCQFSFACDGSMRHGLEHLAWVRAQKIALRAMSGAVVSGVGNATHFHTLDVQPDWQGSLLRVTQIGMHIFYRIGHNLTPADQVLVGLDAAAGLPEDLLPGPVASEAGRDPRLVEAVPARSPSVTPEASDGSEALRPVSTRPLQTSAVRNDGGPVGGY